MTVITLARMELAFNLCSKQQLNMAEALVMNLPNEALTQCDLELDKELPELDIEILEELRENPEGIPFDEVPPKLLPIPNEQQEQPVIAAPQTTPPLLFDLEETPTDLWDPEYLS